jgi:hypothetical protein
MAFRLDLLFSFEGLLICMACGFTSMALGWLCNE